MNNSEKLKKYHQAYHQANKEKIHKRKNEKCSCDCGGKYTRAHKSAHKKTKKHQEWEKSQTPPVVQITSKPIEEIMQEVIQILKDRGYT